ncbi:MAG TPA: LacI family transcriptional regulator [Anaerolineaceae bacterium]|nr:LacI family transcriptional regulator [Anaerolineaceae bacterium]
MKFNKKAYIIFLYWERSQYLTRKSTGICLQNRSASLNNLTLEDIAEQCGVSRSTVSRVINNHPNVSKKARMLVQEVINQTGYQPHAAARALVSNRSWTVGLILPRSVNSFFTDPYYPSLIQGIAQACSSSDYTFTLFLMREKEDEERIFHRISRRGFLDGILLQSDNIGDSLIDKLILSDIPLTVLGRPFKSGNISFIDINNVESVEKAVDYFIETEHKRIGTITGPLNTTVGIDRKQGYMNSLLKHGFTVDKDLIAEGTFTEESGYLGMLEILKAKPDAVFTASDQMALGAMRAMSENGLRAPDDVAIIGFDDFPLQMPAYPPLSTIRQPIDEFGNEALRMLIDIIENGTEPARRVILKTELILRGTTRKRIN